MVSSATFQQRKQGTRQRDKEKEEAHQLPGFRIGMIAENEEVKAQ